MMVVVTGFTETARGVPATPATSFVTTSGVIAEAGTCACALLGAETAVFRLEVFAVFVAGAGDLMALVVVFLMAVMWCENSEEIPVCSREL